MLPLPAILSNPDSECNSEIKESQQPSSAVNKTRQSSTLDELLAITTSVEIPSVAESNDLISKDSSGVLSKKASKTWKKIDEYGPLVAVSSKRFSIKHQRKY